MKNQTQQPRNPLLMRSNRSVIILAAIIIVGMVVVWLLQINSARARDEEHYQANRERIEKMSREDRERVQRNAKRFFDEFTEEQRQQCRDLHKNLQTAENAAELKRTMNRYNAWLATLSPYKRDDLREQLHQAADATSRRKIVVKVKSDVEKIKSDQDHEKWVRSLPRKQQYALRLEKDPKKRELLEMRFREEQERRLASGESAFPPPSRRRFGSRRAYGPRLNPEELESVLNLLVAKLDLPDVERRKIQEYIPARRHVCILHEAVKVHRKNKGAGFLKDSHLKTLIVVDSVGSTLKDRLDKLVRSPGDHDLLRTLVRSVIRERFMRRRKLTDEELSVFFQKLDGDDRERIMKYRGVDQRRRLEYMYFQKKRDESSVQFRDFMGSLEGVIPYWGRRQRPSRTRGPGHSSRTGRNSRGSQRNGGRPGGKLSPRGGTK